MSFQDIQQSRGYGAKGKIAFQSQSQSQAVAAGIFQINTAVGTFRRLVDAVGTAKDTPDHRQKLHNTRQKVLQLVKDTSAKLKSLTEETNATNPNKKIEDAKLARDFQTTLQEFQKVQQLAAERESSYTPANAPSLSSSSASGEQVGHDNDLENRPFLGEQKRQQILLLDNEIAFNEAMIDERDQGIREIQEQIGQANDIFKDLAVLVHEQGVVIDDIGSNIDSTAGASTQAKNLVSKASKGMKSNTSWCWWILIILIVAVLVLFLIFIL